MHLGHMLLNHATKRLVERIKQCIWTWIFFTSFFINPCDAWICLCSVSSCAGIGSFPGRSITKIEAVSQVDTRTPVRQAQAQSQGHRVDNCDVIWVFDPKIYVYHQKLLGRLFCVHTSTCVNWPKTLYLCVLSRGHYNVTWMGRGIKQVVCSGVHHTT